MKDKIFYAQYKRALATPFVYGSKSLSHREGFLFRKNESFSEAAPLPGHSKENIDEISKELKKYGFQREKFPSLRFARGSLDFDPKSSFFSVPSNALLSFSDRNGFIDRLRELYSKGYKTIKIKVAEQNIFTISDLLAQFGSEYKDVKYRFDGNQSISRDTCQKFFSDFEKKYHSQFQIEYFEEPTTDFFCNPIETIIPIAADESANDRQSIYSLLEGEHSPDFFVLKSMLHGDPNELTALSRKIESWGKRVVFTSTLETEVGRRSLIHYLSSIENKSAAGLSTGYIFSENYLPDQPEYKKNPQISAKEISFLNTLDWQELPC